MSHDCHVKRDKTHTSVSVCKCCGAISRKLSAEKSKWDWTCISGFHSGRLKHCRRRYKSNGINKAWTLRTLRYQRKLCTRITLSYVFTQNQTWSNSRTVIAKCGGPATGTHGGLNFAAWSKNLYLNHKLFLEREGELLRLLFIAEDEPAAFWASIELPQAGPRLQTGLPHRKAGRSERTTRPAGRHAEAQVWNVGSLSASF